MNVKYRLLTLLALSASLVALAAGCSSLNSQRSASEGLQASSGAAAGRQEPAPPPAPLKSDLLIPDQPSVELWVKKFSVEKHKSFQTQLDRARYYVVPAQEVFGARGLPKDLVFVALVESGFTPKARSHASAVGMYQFISSTGKRYGLEQNRYVDERCHPMKAARAAADYLSFLYDTFGSWPLAIAAYNAGEKAVQDALDRSRLKTFWELADNGYLPSETRDYVPKVLATVKIVRDPDAYGFRFDPQYHVTDHEPVPVPGGVKLSWVGKKIGVPEAALQNCNPELCKSVTPPGCSNYDLCVPVGKGGDLVAALAACPPETERADAKESPQAAHSLAAYKVKKGDTWSSLARKHNCTAQSLAALNGSKTSHPLKAGQTLKVPSRQQALAAADTGGRKSGDKVARADSVSTKTRDKPAAASTGRNEPSKPGKKSPRTIQYPVRQGDTLTSIAARFHVSVKSLCARNKLKETRKLMPGELLTIDSCQQDAQLDLRKPSGKKMGM